MISLSSAGVKMSVQCELALVTHDDGRTGTRSCRRHSGSPARTELHFQQPCSCSSEPAHDDEPAHDEPAHDDGYASAGSAAAGAFVFAFAVTFALEAAEVPVTA